MTESQCHPDSNHWCIECCVSINCCLLKLLADGSIGCSGHINPVKNNDEILHQRPLCQDFDCLTMHFNIEDEAKPEILDLIKTLPRGEFKMTYVVNLLNYQKD